MILYIYIQQHCNLQLRTCAITVLLDYTLYYYVSVHIFQKSLSGTFIAWSFIFASER